MSSQIREPRAVPGPGVSFEEADELKRQVETLRSRLSWLSEATLRVNQNLDLADVLQEVIDGARSLTDAHYGGIATFDESGQFSNLTTSGFPEEFKRRLESQPQGQGLNQFMYQLQKPVIIDEIPQYVKTEGLPKDHPQMRTFLGAPISHNGDTLGNIYVAEKDSGRKFTQEDKDTIVMFASHAAEAILNARAYEAEHRAKADLEALNNRFLRLTEAVRILSESLDVDTVLHQIVTGARVLTGAHYGLLTTVDESGRLVDFDTSGFTPEERQLMMDMPRGTELLDHFHTLPHPWRVPDATAHIRDLGFPGSLPPFKATLCTPMYFRGARLGNFYLANREGDLEFTQEDEDLMSVFAAQAAVSVVNARAYEAEHKAKTDLEALNDRFIRLSESGRTLSENLDLDTVLQGVIDGARSLSGARYGALVVLDEDWNIQELITSGITPEETDGIKAAPKGLGLLAYLNEVEGPLRLQDIAGHPRSVGFPEGHPPMKSFLGIPVRHQGERLGNIYLTEKEGSLEFTPEDEETIAVFASYAATAISNARRYSDERRAKADLEVLNDRFIRLSESGRILSESLEVDTVLNQIVAGARVLTGAHYGLVTTVDDSGQLVDFGTSGFTPEERQLMVDMPRGVELLDYFHTIPHPWRAPDATTHIRDLGFTGSLPPFKATLCMPMYFGDTRLGNFYLSNREGGPEFTREDEYLMSVFAAQAAVSVANARAYQAEHRARSDLRALLDTSPVGVVVFDAKTMDLVSVNQETRRIARGIRSGYSRAELFATLIGRRPDGQEIPFEELPPARAVRNGETVRAEEMIIGLPDGQTVPVIVNATPVYSEEGEAVSVIVTIQDMTPMERMERLRSEFIRMVSRELRTPLAAIKGSAATVLGASSHPDYVEMRQFFQVIDEQADRMRGLIGELLDMTNIEAGTLSVALEPTGVEELVEEARRAFLLSGVTNAIEADIPPDMPPIEVDRQRIVHVLNSLFTFASRHAPDQSTIRVSAAADGVHVSISVVDEGRGVPAEDLPHLFRKYYPGFGEDGNRPPTGEGLSLAICKGVVEAHGGRIWAESGGLGLGTRVTFTVLSLDEAAKSPAAGSGQRATDPERTAGERERVLVVDDEPQMRLLVRNALREAGYVPIITGNSAETERLIETDKPHLVLLNPAATNPGGMEIMGRIRDLSDAPVILMSEQGGDEDVALAFEMGADDYISKPFSPPELVARIRAAMRRQSSPGRTQTTEPYLLGDLMIDYAERRVTVAGRPVQLTSTEYRLLSDLSTNAGRVLTHDQLLSRIWGPGYAGDSQPVRTFVKNLRNKLGDDAKNPTYIFTEPRVGYRMAKSGGGGGRKPGARD